MSGVEALDKSSCAELALRGEYITVGSPTVWSDEWKGKDSNEPADGLDDTNSAQSACFVEDNGRLWYLMNKDSNDPGWSQCDGLWSTNNDNQFCYCTSGKMYFLYLGIFLVSKLNILNAEILTSAANML